MGQGNFPGPSMSRDSVFIVPGAGQSTGSKSNPRACCHEAASLLGNWNQVTNEPLGTIQNIAPREKG